MSDRREERKVVTVLFCDLVGFTQRAEEMDPEDVAALLGPYYTRLKEELERHGGTVEKFIGDAVMALFGAPSAHEDDPERAVRAALAIREFADDEGIELRIGITTGEALVVLGARPAEGETMATGDVVNTAARLEAAAPVNGILVSEKTREATKDTIEYRETKPVEAKGKTKPVPVWVAVRARSRIALDRPHATPLIGRDRELDQLVGALGRVRADRQPQLVTLVGVPGIGKSRLVYELSQAADRDPELISWRQGRCLPYGDGVTFWALAEIVKAHVGILETDAAEVVEQKLRDAAPDEWERMHLRPLVGLGVDGLGEGDRREEAFTAWRRFFEEIAARGPLTLVFEDLHWADDSLLDFIDHLVDWASGSPLLVVCTTRPELLERRPAWGGGKTNALTVSLSPLSDEETTRLVGGLTGKSVLPAETHEALLARAGGNPLYAEQYARLLEDGVAGELELPETVQGVIAARLDVLDPEQKALLQDAAVVGKTFWLGALASVSGAERRTAEVNLHGLERKGFVRRERETSIEGDTEYAFLHVLVRDVAYGQIPRAPRSKKHRLTARWIEGLGRSEDHAEMLAHHYGEALALAHAAGLDTASLEEPAGRALRDAGDRAMALNAYAAALRFYERALELWREGGVERARLLFHRARAHYLAVDEARTDLLEEARDALLAEGDRESAAEAQMLAASALRVAGRDTDALEAAHSAAALLADAPLSRAKGYVLANRARLIAVTGPSEEAIDECRKALVVAEELGLPELKAMALNSIGIARMVMGDFGGMGEQEESLALVLEHGSPFEIARVYNNLGGGYQLAGQLDRAYEVLTAALETSERYGLDVRMPKIQVIWIAHLSGRWDEATRRADEFLAEDAPPIPAETGVRIIRALLRLARDDLAGAAADSARGLELLRQQQTPEVQDTGEPFRIYISAYFALAEGRLEAAQDLTDELCDAVRIAVDEGVGFWGEQAVEVALLFADLGRPQDVVLEAASARPDDPWLKAAAAIARGELEDAANRLAGMGARPFEAAVRLRAAAALVAASRRVEADAQLQRALAFYRPVGATRYIRQGEALLAATG